MFKVESKCPHCSNEQTLGLEFDSDEHGEGDMWMESGMTETHCYQCDKRYWTYAMATIETKESKTYKRNPVLRGAVK